MTTPVPATPAPTVPETTHSEDCDSVLAASDILAGITTKPCNCKRVPEPEHCSCAEPDVHRYVNEPAHLFCATCELDMPAAAPTPQAEEGEAAPVLMAAEALAVLDYLRSRYSRADILAAYDWLVNAE
jgi:hypothetical protein